MSTPVYDPNDANSRFKIRTGQTDPAEARRYRPSESGVYDINKDPHRDVNQTVGPPPAESYMLFDETKRRRQDYIDQYDSESTQFAVQQAWEKQRTNQEAQYASYLSVAQSLGGMPYLNPGNQGMYVKTLDNSETGQLRTTIVNAALSQVNNRNLRYSWGGGGSKGPGYGINGGGALDSRNVYGFDCSGLVQYAYARAGISLGRHSTAQTTTGRIVPISSLKPGDLVGWGRTPSTSTHVAVYIGNGMIAEAANTRDNLRVRSLTNSGFDSNAFGVSIFRG